MSSVSSSELPRGSTLAAALTTQCRVIQALLMRESAARYGEHKLGFAWSIVEPAAFVAIFVAFRAAISPGDISGMAAIAFMVTGFVPFIMFRNMMSRMQSAISANRRLLSFPQVTTFDVAVSRGLLEVAIGLTVLCVMLTVTHLHFEPLQIERPLDVLAAIAMLAMLGFGMGFLFATLAPLWPSLQQFTSVMLGRPLFFTSGLFFTADSIPEPFRGWLLYNPILHMIEMLRSAFFREFESTHASPAYAIGWAFGALAFGLLVHQALKRRAVIGI